MKTISVKSGKIVDYQGDICYDLAVGGQNANGKTIVDEDGNTIRQYEAFEKESLVVFTELKDKILEFLDSAILDANSGGAIKSPTYATLRQQLDTNLTKSIKSLEDKFM